MSYDMTDGGVAAYHRLQLEGREKLSVSGVEDVVRFDENCIVTTTSAGTLIITGEELHIGKLSLEGGAGRRRDAGGWPHRRRDLRGYGGAAGVVPVPPVRLTWKTTSPSSCPPI